MRIDLTTSGLVALAMLALSMATGCVEESTTSCQGDDDCFRGEVCRSGRCVDDGDTDGERDGGTDGCTPGRETSCACVGLGEVGVQTCRSDGSWGECRCPDAGVPTDGGDATEADTSSDVDEMLEDAGPDARDAGADARDTKEATCSDDIENGNETDVDCGGDCQACEVGGGCGSPADCKTGFCKSGRCVTQACAGVSCGSSERCYRGDCYGECGGGSSCGSDEVCHAGVCLPTDCQGVSCNKSEACHKGICRPTCDDGKFCNVDEVRLPNGACTGGHPRDCNQNPPNACWTYACDEMKDECVQKNPEPDGTPCDDGNRCTVGDQCRVGSCTSGANRCRERRLSVDDAAEGAPSFASVGLGSYVGYWPGGQNGSYIRLTDRTDSRRGEERHFDKAANNNFETRVGPAGPGRSLVVTHRGKTWSDECGVSGLSCSRNEKIRLDHSIELRIVDRSGAVRNQATLDVDAVCHTDGNDNAKARLLGIRAFPVWFSQGGGGLVLGTRDLSENCRRFDLENVVTGRGNEVTGLHFVPFNQQLQFGSAVRLVADSELADFRNFHADLIPDGTDRFVVAWRNKNDEVVAQPFDSTGTKAGTSQPIVLGNQSSRGPVYLEGTQGGEFVVSWRKSDGQGSGAFIRRAKPAGSTTGAVGRVNTSAPGDQTPTGLTALSNGDVVAAFTGNDNVHARMFSSGGSPKGSPFKLNERTVGKQSGARLVGLRGDEWVAGFRDDSGRVWTRRFDKNGDPVLRGPVRGVSQLTDGDQARPAAARRASGGTAVVWQGPPSGKPAEREVFARLFESSGRPAGPQRRINSQTTDEQAAPDVDAGPDGYVAVWESMNQDGSGNGVFGRQLSKSGKTKGSEFRVNVDTMGSQSQPSVAVATSGTFFVAWQHDGDVKARAFDKSASGVSGSVKLASNRSGNQAQPQVVAHPTLDEFAVVWQSSDSPGDSKGVGVSIRKFDAQGNPLSGERTVNAAVSGAQNHPELAVSDTGTVAVCWRTFGQDNASSQGIACRLADWTSGLKPSSNEVVANTYVEGDQRHPAVAFPADDKLLVGWTTPGVDSEATAVQIQQFELPALDKVRRIVPHHHWSGEQERVVLAPFSTTDYHAVWESAGQDGDGDGVFLRPLPVR